MNETDQKPKGERIAKYLSRAGVCSRRDAERFIAEGRVTCNGDVVTTPATFVMARDVLTVDGKTVGGKEPTRLWCYHKPRGLVTSHRDEQGRRTIFDSLPNKMPRVMSVGRLDLNSEGLLLLTNDGALSRHLELPATAWARTYRVRIFGRLTSRHITQLKQGVRVEGVDYGSIEAIIEKEQGDNTWIKMTLYEGKNREIRRVLSSFGLEVSRLIRVSYGVFELGDLCEGCIVEISKSEMISAIGAGFVQS